MFPCVFLGLSLGSRPIELIASHWISRVPFGFVMRFDWVCSGIWTGTNPSSGRYFYFCVFTLLSQGPLVGRILGFIDSKQNKVFPDGRALLFLILSSPC
jgi:hypothetical protein